MKKNKHNIFVKTPQYEILLEDLCEQQYQKTVNLLALIEKEFDTTMHDHQKLRSEILNLSNFTRRIPQMVEDVIEVRHE